jgi:hypothetical protein
MTVFLSLESGSHLLVSCIFLFGRRAANNGRRFTAPGETCSRGHASGTITLVIVGGARATAREN